MTGNRVLAFFLVATIILIPLGAAILAASLSVTEYKVRYDNVGNGYNDPSKTVQQQTLWADTTNQTVNFRTTKILKAPVFVYYELQSYYQNHKRYVRSLNSDQTGGQSVAPSHLGACAPQQYADILANGDPAPPNTAINPCGLMAYSYFNDTFDLLDASGSMGLDSSNIAWSSDRTDLYGDYTPSFFNDNAQSRGGGAIRGNVSDDQHFLVWMRPGAARTVRKLYAQINEDIPAAVPSSLSRLRDHHCSLMHYHLQRPAYTSKPQYACAGTDLTLVVRNQYNTYAFGGAKWVVLTTNSWVGGHNNALGSIMLTIGGLAFLTAIIFFCLYHLNKKRRKFADPNYLSWNRTSLVH